MVRRNSDQWFRFYVRTLNNPKVQRLPSKTFKGWINLLCLAKETDGLLPPVEDISFRLRLTKSKTEALLNTLESNGLIDGTSMHDWDEMQYPSDSSTLRVKQHRERAKKTQSNVSSNVSVTPQIRTDTDTETDTDTDTETEKMRARGASPLFDEFWNLYPKKTGKLAAQKSWKALTYSQMEESIDAIKNQVENNHFDHRKSGKVEIMIPLPTTWLNQGRWEDEVIDKEKEHMEEHGHDRWGWGKGGPPL